MSDVAISMGIAKWIAPQDPTYSSADNNDPSLIQVLVPLEGQGYNGPVNFASQWGQQNGVGDFTIAQSQPSLTYSYSNVPAGYEFLGIWAAYGNNALLYHTADGPISPTHFSRTKTNASGGSFTVTAFAVIREITTTYTLQFNVPAGVSVSGNDKFVYNDGEMVTVTANPDTSSGYSFVQWRRDDENGTVFSLQNPLTFAMTQDRTFYPEVTGGTTQYTVTVAGSTGGNWYGGGNYNQGSVATMIATPKAGYEFVKWVRGTNASGNQVTTSTSFTQTVTSDISFYAVFQAQITQYQVTLSRPSIQTVSGTGTYNAGSTVTVTASAASGWEFTQWEEGGPGGALVSTQNPYSFVINAHRQLYAKFSVPAVKYNLQVSASTGGSVAGAISGDYNEGTNFTLSAIPDSGYQFVNWTNNQGAFLSATDPLDITMNSNKDYVARFQLANTTSFSVGQMVWHNGVEKEIASISGSIITFTDGTSTGAAGVSSSPPNNTIFVVGQLVWYNGVQKEIASINGTTITFTDGTIVGHSLVSASEPLPPSAGTAIRNDVGRHIYDLGTKEIPGAEDLFLLSTTESDNSRSAKRTKFKDMSTALMSDMGQSKNGVSTGGFLTQNYPQLIGGPKTFLSDEFLKIQRTNGTLGNLVDGEVYNIWEYVNAAVSGDDLGNHVATQNLKMGSYSITHSGGAQQGIKLGNDGSVGIGFDGNFNWSPTSEYPFTVKGAKASKGYLVGFDQEASGVSTLRLTGATETTSQNFIDGDIGGTLKFNIDYKGGAHFKDNLVVGKAITGGNGKFLLSAGGDLTLNGSTTTQALTVKKNALFAETANFAKTTTFGGATTFSNTATFNKSTTFKESATFTKSTVFNESPVFNKNITLGTGATIVDSNGRSAGTSISNGLERNSNGEIIIKLGEHFSTAIGGEHCGLEWDDQTPPGIRLSTKESTAMQGNFHGIVLHPPPDAPLEGGHISLKKPSTANNGTYDYIIDSYTDQSNLYWTVHPQDLESDKGLNAATANSLSKTADRDVLRIGHEHAKVLGLYIGESMIVTNQHMRIADGNGHACLYAGSGKHGTMATDGSTSSTRGHFVFRTTKNVNDLSQGYTEMAKIGHDGMWSLGTSVSSDRRLKKDIKKLDSAELLKKALKLKPSSFKKKIQNEENKTSFGLIAQEVQKIIPEVVSTRKEEIESGGLKNTLSICYEQIIPVLCGAIQEQQKQIEELKKDIKKLKG